MEAVVDGLLRAQRLTFAVAESCTGGLIGHRLTSIPGSSDYLDRVLVCYSNRSKMELLSVPARMLREHGAVSAHVVTAMAEGLLKLSGVHLSLAVTGIAGPTGGTKEKPVGSVYIGLARSGAPAYSSRVGHAGESHSRFCHFTGGRDSIKFQASQMALDTVRRWLLGIKS